MNETVWGQTSTLRLQMVKEDASHLCGSGRTSWRRSAWDTSDNRKLGAGSGFALPPGYATGLRAEADV